MASSSGPVPDMSSSYVYRAGAENDITVSNTSSPLRAVNTNVPLKRSTGNILKLSGSAPFAPKSSDILPYITLNQQLKNLPIEQQQQIKGKCLAAYEASVAAFEEAVGSLASKHIGAKEFAQEMCQRIYAVAYAYNEIKVEEQGIGSYWKDLKVRLGTDVEFTTYGDGKGSGSVGFNPLAIEKSVREGNFREQMMLIYASLWTALPKIFEDPSMVSKVNAKLKSFQINENLLNEKRTQAKLNGIIDPVVAFFAQAKPLDEFRNTGGRITDSNRPKEPPKQLKEIDNLSIREARATREKFISEDEFRAMKEGKPSGKELAESTVQWVRGKDLYRIDPNSDFYKKAITLGSLPVITGPSGTADGYLLGLKYLNMNDYEDKAILALIAWMVPSEHTLHEIRVAGTWHGIEYPEGPKAFQKLYSDDPKFMESVQEKMNVKGVKLPGYYLEDEFQLQVAKDLKYIK